MRIPQLFTDLMVASYFGHRAVIKLLLNKRTSVKANDESGRTPLSWACESGHEAFLKLPLGRGASWGITLVRRRYREATEMGGETVVKLLQQKSR